MADGTTTNLGLTLPEVGASTDSWGRKLNDDLIFLDNVFSRADPATTVTLLINNQEIETTNSYTLSTVLLGDDRQLQFGAAPDYHLIYNATDTRLELNTADNGSGAGTVFKVEDGADTVDFTGKVTAASLTLASPATNVTGISTDTSLGSSDALLATQGAVKTYVDAQVGSFDTLAEVLAAGNTTESTDIVVTAGQKITTDTILETTTDAGVTIDSVVLKDGAIATGTWNGNVIQATYGGSGLVGAADGTIAIADGSGAPTTLDVGSSTGITIVGALNAGSITSGFTSIDVGDGAITTTGTVSATTLAGTLSTATQNSVTTATGLVTVGTITSGIWASTDVAVAHGGTGASSAAAAATNLGLGTGDSPQFTAVNVGGASDTTLSRKSAGVLQVESSELYVQGGTDVAVADGGTALSSYAAGDIIYASGTTTLAKLAKGSDTQVLTLALGVPTWASPTVGDITEIVAGAGLTGTSLSGPIPTLNVIGTSGTITVSADAVTIASDYVGQTSITTVGDLDAGSITSGFGAINNGASDITTTGTVSATTLTGTLSTEAQTNITSVGTLTSLALSGNITMADDTSIGISDSDERIEFDGAGDISVLGANFGIGTDAPGAPLHIYKDLAAPDDLGDFDNYHLVVQNATDTGKAAGILLTTSANEYGGSAIVHYDTGSNGIGDMVFYTKQSTSAEPPVEVMRLDEAGNVGISTTSPRAIVDFGPGSGDGTLSQTLSQYQAVFEAPQGTGDYSRNIAFAVTTNAIAAAINAVDEGGSSATGLALATGTAGSITNALTIDSSQNVLVELTTADVLYTLTPKLQVETTGSDAGMSVFRNENGAGGPYMFLGKSRGTSVNSDTIVQDNDVLGSLMWVGADGSDRNSHAASIIAYVDGSPGTDDMPGRLELNTSADGAASPTLGLRIDSSQDVNIPNGGLAIGTTSSPAGLLSLESAGDTFLQFELTGTGANVWNVGMDNNDGAFKIIDGAAGTTPALTIDTSGNVGIGTTSPQTALNIERDDGSADILLSRDSTGAFGGSNDLGKLQWGGNDSDSGFNDEVAYISGQSANDWTSSSFPSKLLFATCASGATTPTVQMLLADTGRLVLYGDLAVPQGEEIFLDGGGNTYIESGTTDRFDVVAGGTTAFWVYKATGQGYTNDVKLWSPGDLELQGSIEKTSGTFKIDHPLPDKKDTHHLVHSFIEGPRADLIYRGTVDLSGGYAQVDLDDASGMTEGTFEALTRDHQCWIQNDTGWGSVRGSVEGNTLTVECEATDSDDTVSWMVVAERCDPHIYETGWTDDDGRPIVEPEKPEEEE
jgi:hypothetical protein